ncbi:MAG: GIY-YIG nuclease family protein [Patescibacteria group bacterium]|jgi:putative endonuclease
MRKEYQFFVYILSNYERTTLYVGFTNNIIRRMIEHKNGLGSKFTKLYKLTDLLYYEQHQYVNDAISREKEIKKWRREKKINLIKSKNKMMNDLSDKLFSEYDISEKEIKDYVGSLKNN